MKQLCINHPAWIYADERSFVFPHLKRELIGPEVRKRFVLYKQCVHDEQGVFIHKCGTSRHLLFPDNNQRWFLSVSIMSLCYFQPFSTQEILPHRSIISFFSLDCVLWVRADLFFLFQSLVSRRMLVLRTDRAHDPMWRKQARVDLSSCDIIVSKWTQRDVIWMEGKTLVCIFLLPSCLKWQGQWWKCV